jgi:hypothetical protein
MVAKVTSFFVHPILEKSLSVREMQVKISAELFQRSIEGGRQITNRDRQWTQFEEFQANQVRVMNYCCWFAIVFFCSGFVVGAHMYNHCK